MTRFLLKIFLLACFSFKMGEMKTKYPYSIKSVGISCKGDPQYITNLTCFIRAVRGKQGLVNLIYDFQNMPKNDTWCHSKLFFRNSGGHFLPYLVDDDLNFCTFKEELKSSKPSVKKILVKIGSEIAQIPFATLGCPLKEGPRIVDVNVDDIKENFFPPVVPEGRFYINFRAYFKQNNHTIFEMRHHFVIKSTGVMQLSMLNMG